MNTTQAIKIKKRYQYILQDASLPELIEADNLSIEALKARRRDKKLPYVDLNHLLPGETEV